MKENVICGKLIPAGTGLREYDRIVVGSKDDLSGLLDPEALDAEIIADSIVSKS